MATGGRYPMGTGWQAGVQTRQSLGITYRYSAGLLGGAGYRGRGGNNRTQMPAATFTNAARPTRVNIRGGRSR